MTNDEVIRFYKDGYRESDRLTAGAHGQLEYLRTQVIIGRRLADRPMRIADIGGGPGIYAAWLASLGHDVELIDPVEDHIRQARSLSVEPGSIQASVGDARNVELDNESVDAVLLLGPLYHLPERADRTSALGEARRILRPGGLIFAAAISRFTSLHDGLTRGWLRDPAFAAIVDTDLITGCHKNPAKREGWFTDAYFHRPEELRDELVNADFQDVSVHGIEGLAGWLPNLQALMEDPDEQAVILDGLDRTGTESCLLGVSAHLLACGSRPD